jgi:hypothetical protein
MAAGLTNPTGHALTFHQPMILDHDGYRREEENA